MKLVKITVLFKRLEIEVESVLFTKPSINMLMQGRMTSGGLSLSLFLFLALSHWRATNCSSSNCLEKICCHSQIALVTYSTYLNSLVCKEIIPFTPKFKKYILPTFQ